MARANAARRPFAAPNVWRLLALLALSLLCLQAYFVLRVAMMTVIDPTSTSFQRSEMARLARTHGVVAWAHQWVDARQIADNLKRAVIASEDAGFVEHSGVEWDAIERAWERNQRETDRAERLAESGRARLPKVIGGSTITQQLAKNIFLSGERTTLRKAQELVITFALESMLSKARILEIYLNNVEFGEGLFGAQMAARYYHRIDASRLSAPQAARLAVMLPAPKRFEKRPQSAYIHGRSQVILARMGAVELP